jgi:hypothetical protein
MSDNTGTVPVSIFGVSVTLTSAQGNANDFSVSLYSLYYYYGYNCSNDLPPGTTNQGEAYPYGCGVSVTFTPSVAGTETATISITDSTSASPHTFTVSGIGVAATQTLESMPGDAVYANQPVGYPSAAQTFYFYNTGTSPMTVSRVLTTGDFQVSSSSCEGETLNPNASNNCGVQVTFTPTATGVRTGTLELVDSATGSPQVFSLAGTGITPAGNIVVTPDSLVFATQPTGTTSAYQTVSFQQYGQCGCASEQRYVSPVTFPWGPMASTAITSGT